MGLPYANAYAFQNDALKLVSEPGESREAFEERCKQQASQGSSKKTVEKIKQKYAKLKKYPSKIKLREELELERDKDVLQAAPLCYVQSKG